MNTPTNNFSEEKVYPVYILKRVVDQLVDYCKKEAPIEALGILIGWHYQLPAPNSHIRFSKITDWVTGEVDASHVGAQFTERGISEYNMYLDEKYTKERPNGPMNLGLFHSHPFGFEPHFSNTDYSTFLVFPYNAEYNVFILIDPVPDVPYFKVFQLRTIENELKLVQVPWIEYSPISKDFNEYTVIQAELNNESPDNSISDAENNSTEEDVDPIFNPPEIEEINGEKKKKSTDKKKFTLKDYF